MAKVVSFVERKARDDAERQALAKRSRRDRQSLYRRASRSVPRLLERALADAYEGKFESIAIVAVLKGRTEILTTWSITPTDRILLQYGAIHKLANDFHHSMMSV